ncbi:MAG: Ig-like domain-containing protein, partial [Clostridiales bacterium]|nr:Ig-like domain-containing protein [Clostridiales bacterium]
ADIPVEAVCKDTAVDAPSCVNESSATKVFALSISDLNTSYLKDRSKRTSICHSWLRSPGALSGNAAFLTGDGDIYAWPTEYNTGCTRPAMWIGKAEGNTQTAQVTIVNGKSKIAVAEEVILSYTVNPAGYDDGKNINWSSSNQDAATVSANPGGTATVTGIAQGTSTITLTIGTGEEEISKSINVTVSGDSVIIPGLPDSGWDNNQVGKKITVDGRDWRIIKADGNGNLLIVSEKTIEKTAFSAADNNDYAVSDLKALMDGYYEDNKWPTLFSCVKGADIPCEATNAGTDTKSAPSSVNESSQTFVFALSVSDMNTSSLEIAADNPYWLRSAGAMGSNVVCAMKFNAFMGISANNSDGYTRPAMWIGLPQQ